jgi:hypothetical protein
MYYKDVVLKKLKKKYKKRRLKHIRLLHDKAPSYNTAIVAAFLKKEKSNCFASPQAPSCYLIYFFFQLKLPLKFGK